MKNLEQDRDCRTCYYYMLLPSVAVNREKYEACLYDLFENQGGIEALPDERTCERYKEL